MIFFMSKAVRIFRPNYGHMNIKQYLDSTYLKTPEQSGLSEDETRTKVLELTEEAHYNEIFAVMIRPDFVKEVKNHLEKLSSPVKVGTVIGFHEGTASLQEKLAEAQQAIADGADELDFVVNYEAYKSEGEQPVKEEVTACSKLCLSNGKICKWIIEAAALSNEQIAGLTGIIADCISEQFPGQEEMVFVKSSTGFYETEAGRPNGATIENIKIMLENAGKLPVKAAGGVRTAADATKMIKMGVQRIGTSAALDLMKGDTTAAGY